MADRIAVIGIIASGKSVFARELARLTGLPLRHGDELDWLAGWKERPPAELAELHEAWLADPRWIIEGWIDPERAHRLSLADVVIDLDLSRWCCTWRVFKRMLSRKRRSEMPEGCVDRFQPHVLKWVFFKQERPSIDAALGCATIRRYVRLTTPREVRAWLSGLEEKPLDGRVRPG